MTALPRPTHPTDGGRQRQHALRVVAATIVAATLGALGAAIPAIIGPDARADAATLAVGAGALVMLGVAFARRTSSARRRSEALLEGE